MVGVPTGFQTEGNETTGPTQTHAQYHRYYVGQLWPLSVNVRHHNHPASGTRHVKWIRAQGVWISWKV